MEYNLSQSEQTEFLPIKNANLPVGVVIHKRINVKCPVSGNISKDSMAEWSPVKRVNISKDFLQQFPKKKKISSKDSFRYIKDIKELFQFFSMMYSF